MDAWQKFQRDQRRIYETNDARTMCRGPWKGEKCPDTAFIASGYGVLEPRCPKCFEAHRLRLREERNR